MLNYLPDTLEIGGKPYKIRTDFRVALTIFSAFEDKELTDHEKCYVCMKCLYEDFDSIPQDNMQEAAEKAFWFVGGGDMPKSDTDLTVMNWEKDEYLIFPALSKVAGYEVRSVPHLHWWVLMGLFNEVGDGLFSQVLAIRIKLARGKKLEKHEREFYNANRRIIDINRLTDKQEREDAELIRKITGEA